MIFGPDTRSAQNLTAYCEVLRLQRQYLSPLSERNKEKTVSSSSPAHKEGKFLGACMVETLIAQRRRFRDLLQTIREGRTHTYTAKSSSLIRPLLPRTHGEAGRRSTSQRLFPRHPQACSPISEKFNPRLYIETAQSRTC